MVEKDVLGHLIDIERLAFDMTLNAQTEADRRKTEAKEEAEQVFRTHYEQTIASLEISYKEQKAILDANHHSIISNFDTQLDQIKPDTISFNLYLNSLFFGH